MNKLRRFLSASAMLYAFFMTVSGLLAELPASLGSVSLAWLAFWRPIVTWLGVRGFHLDPSDLMVPWGDSAFAYLLSFCFLVAAFAGGVLWAVLEPEDRTSAVSRAWLDLSLRAWLAVSLFSYGFVKIFPSQFPALDAGTLMTPVGDLDPSRLYWTAMGHAPAYAIFAGLLEVSAGILLLFRQTTLVGALLAAGVMANVVVVNYAYSVGVFFLSLQLLAAATLLLALEWRRLLAFAAGKAMPELSAVEVARPLRWVFGIVMALALGGSAFSGWRAWRIQVAHRSPPLVGGYEIESFALDGRDRPLLMTDESCWKRVWIADLAPIVYIYTMDGGAHGFHMKLDGAARTMNLEGPSIPGPSALRYSMPDPGHLALEGRLGTHDVSALLRKVDPAQMPLNSVPFHWISN